MKLVTNIYRQLSHQKLILSHTKGIQDGKTIYKTFPTIMT